MSMRRLVQDLREAKAADTAKKIDLLRQKMRRLTRKDLQADTTLAHPEATLASLAKLAQQAIDLAQPAVAAYQKILDTKGAVVGGFKAKSLQNNIEQAKSSIDALQRLIGDPREYARKALLQYAMYDNEANAAIHYEEQTKRLWQSLRTASSYVAILSQPD